jgi:hypothetical protein
MAGGGEQAEYMGEMRKTQEKYSEKCSENYVSDKWIDGRKIQSSPFITISVYAVSRLLRDIFCDTN